MNEDEDIKKELKEMFPQIPDKRFVSVPENYFMNFPDRVMQRWQKEKTRRGTMFPTFLRIVAIAAMITGLCIGAMWWTNQASVPAPDMNISSADAYDYIMEYMKEFEPLLLQEEYWIEDINIDSKETSAVEDFLIEEMDGVDIETIF